MIWCWAQHDMMLSTDMRRERRKNKLTFWRQRYVVYESVRHQISFQYARDFVPICERYLASLIRKVQQVKILGGLVDVVEARWTCFGRFLPTERFQQVEGPGGQQLVNSEARWCWWFQPSAMKIFIYCVFYVALKWFVYTSIYTKIRHGVKCNEGPKFNRLISRSRLKCRGVYPLASPRRITTGKFSLFLF